MVHQFLHFDYSQIERNTSFASFEDLWNHHLCWSAVKCHCQWESLHTIVHVNLPRGGCGDNRQKQQSSPIYISYITSCKLSWKCTFIVEEQLNLKNQVTLYLILYSDPYGHDNVHYEKDILLIKYSPSGTHHINGMTFFMAATEE